MTRRSQAMLSIPLLVLILTTNDVLAQQPEPPSDDVLAPPPEPSAEEVTAPQAAPPEAGSLPDVLPVPTIASETQPVGGQVISLQAALEKAVEQNPMVVSGELSIEAAIAARKSARANFLPVMTADTTFLVYSEKPGFGSLGGGEDTTFDPAYCTLMDEPDEVGFCTEMIGGLAGMLDFGDAFESKQWNWDVSVTVAQPLTPLYHAYHGYKLTELGIDVAKIELEQTKADLKIQTVEAYYANLKTKAALTSLDEAVVSVEAHVAKAQAFYDAEFITKNDLLQAQVQLAELKGQKLSIEQGVIISQEGLMLILNEPPGVTFVPADDPDAELALITSSGLPMDEGEAIDLAEENRLELKLLAKTKEQAAQAVKLTKGGYIPTVSIFGSYQHNEGSLMVQPDFVFGATLSWNFFQWGKVYYSVQEAEIRAEALVAAEESLSKAVKFEVKQAMLAISLSAKQIEIQKEAVEAAEEQLRIEMERYDKNVNTTTEVLDATTRLVQAKVTLSTFQYEYLVALAKLKKACGTL